MKTTFFIHNRLLLGVALLIFGGCSSQAEKQQPRAGHESKSVSVQRAESQLPPPSTPPQAENRPSSPIAETPAVKASVGFYRASYVSGDFAGYSSLRSFIDYMAVKHGFEREYLNGLFSKARRKQWTLDYFAKSDQYRRRPTPRGSWSRYRAKFLDKRHIQGGVDFWYRHQNALQRASREYGVPAEYILGIMAVETTFGGFVGNHRVIDALTTLAFDYRRRGDYFRGELENFLLMARDESIDPAEPVGSFAGAMGLGQFMPTSFLEWAVDFNGDGRRDLWDPVDSIGSVANYFVEHGWVEGQPVVSPIRGNSSAAKNLEPGLDNLYTTNHLRNVGMSPVIDCRCDSSLRLLKLRHHHKDEYLLGYPNFYVITRYNHSTHYAMAVHELAQAIKRAYRQQIAVR